jgi:hypothetical protein
VDSFDLDSYSLLNVLSDRGANKMKEFLDGFISAAKETPRGFFAPLIAIWRLFCGVTDSVLKKRSLNFIITLKPIFKLNRNFGKSVRRITDASQVKLEINQLKYRGANGLILFPRSAKHLLFFITANQRSASKGGDFHGLSAISA